MRMEEKFLERVSLSGKAAEVALACAHHAIARSMPLPKALRIYWNDIKEGFTYVPIPLLYQVS